MLCFYELGQGGFSCLCTHNLQPAAAPMIRLSLKSSASFDVVNCSMRKSQDEEKEDVSYMPGDGNKGSCARNKDMKSEFNISKDMKYITVTSLVQP